MKTIEINLYKFAELSEKAKTQAIDYLRDINVSHEWWKFTYDDAENVGLKITGFELDRNRKATGYWLTSAPECADKILKEHGETCETHKTAYDFLQRRDALVVKYSDGKQTDRVTEENEYDFDNDCNDLEDEFLKDILEDYSIMLQKESEYLQEDKAIIETIEANDYDFTADGKLA